MISSDGNIEGEFWEKNTVGSYVMAPAGSNVVYSTSSTPATYTNLGSSK